MVKGFAQACSWAVALARGDTGDLALGFRPGNEASYHIHLAPR
jgi:hypothetical protein